MKKSKNIFVIFVILIGFMCVSCVANARVIYSSECNSNTIVLNTLKQYYNAALSQAQGVQIDKRKLDTLQIYSKRVNYGGRGSNLCVFYIDPFDLNLNKFNSSQLYFFSDGSFLFPTVLDTSSGMDLKSYMFSKLEKFTFDSYKGIKIDEGNKRNDDEIVMFLSLECPHCANLYNYLYYYLIQTKKTITDTNLGIKDFNFYIFLTSSNIEKVKLFKGLQDNNINIGTILFDYYGNKNLMLGDANTLIDYYYNNYLNKIDKFKSINDLRALVKKAEVNNMVNEFNRLNIDATPITFINNQPVIGADMSVISVLLKEANIADLNTIDSALKEYSKKMQQQQEQLQKQQGKNKK